MLKAEVDLQYWSHFHLLFAEYVASHLAIAVEILCHGFAKFENHSKSKLLSLITIIYIKLRSKSIIIVRINILPMLDYLAVALTTPATVETGSSVRLQLSVQLLRPNLMIQL